MIKKSIALISAVAMLLSFTACGKAEAGTTTTTEEAKEVVATQTNDGGNVNEPDKIGDKTTDKDGGESTIQNGDGKTTTGKSDDKTTTGKSDDKTTTKKDNGETTTKVTTTEKKDEKPSTKAEIVDYYNKAVNKVKSSAKSVTQTYDNSTNYKGIVEAGGLSKIGKWLMDAFLKENHDKKTYTGKNAIINAFPVETMKTSNITADTVKSAKCEDKGSYYEITLVANCSDSKPDVNPARGGGIVGRMFNILEPKDITDATEGAGALLELTGIKFSYMGGTLTARINKESGKMTYLYTKLPMVLSMKEARAAFISVDNAKIGLQFENKWEIAW